jgi:hypothetical protein
VKAEPAIGVVVDEDEERLRDLGFEPGFLAELAEGGGGRVFAVFDLAAGEFPSACQVLVIGSPCDQEQAVSNDDRERDVEPDSGVLDQAGAPAAPAL